MEFVKSNFKPPFKSLILYAIKITGLLYLRFEVCNCTVNTIRCKTRDSRKYHKYM